MLGFKEEERGAKEKMEIITPIKEECLKAHNFPGLTFKPFIYKIAPQNFGKTYLFFLPQSAGEIINGNLVIFIYSLWLGKMVCPFGNSPKTVTKRSV